ncbi:acyltransferase domain-containing protein [Streptomyces sp. NPDC006739]|uniref:type I polyketide synthase n=1 Tax=Streptomyces sp. NPDC006739 TaxID=3364763 RepID=UPI0036D07A27
MCAMTGADVDPFAGTGTDPAGEAAVPLARRLAATDRAGRHRLLVSLITHHIRALIGALAPEEIHGHETFRDLGLGSLTGVELRGRLGEETGLHLAATAIFDHPTPDDLAAHLLAEILGRRPEPEPAPGPGPDARVPAGTDGVPRDEPVAIVSMACRFPGGVESPEDLWRLVEDGVDAVSEFPTGRGWDLEDLRGTGPDRPGRSHTAEGGFLHEADRFDAAFFGISPREAQAMDPQQRLVLESSWEAVERAGIDPLTLRGTRTGTFVGCAHTDYGTDLRQAPDGMAGHLVTGGAASVLSGRVAYTLGLEGPAVTVDTACSSSLVSLHLAAQSLRAGECTLALAAGVTVMSTSGGFIGMSAQGALAEDGRSKAFSADADGMGMSEGVGVLLLERLSDARRHGHPVLALLRASAVNQDGASNGLTAPRGVAQERVIRQALAAAGLTPGEVDAVEAHGTGTPLGDPIEVRALQQTYGQDRPAGRPLWLGSVKSNIGHTAGAAGVAGVIKTVLAMRHGVLPRTLHADRRSTVIDWTAGAVDLLTEARPWPGAERPRRAGVSSFGISGTNAHVILEQPQDVGETASVPDGGGVSVLGGADGPVPWLVSGRGPAALRAQAVRLRAFVRARPELRPLDVGYTLATGRSAFEDRAAIVAPDRAGLLRGLDALVAGEGAAELTRAVVPRAGGTVFVFPGQGSQWAGMATELLDSSEVFADSLAECGRALAPYVDWSPEQVLRQAPGAPDPDRVDVVQPVLFAVMVSLARLWRAAGVVPDAVLGHSQGEIAAACVAGALSLEDAARVVALRSRALLDAAGSGGMLSVGRPADRVRGELERWNGRLSVAAVNGPASVVVAGDDTALDAYAADCEERGVRVRRIAVDYASHSAHMEPLRERVLDGLSGITPGAGHTAFHSCVTGGAMDTTGLDAAYWYRNLRGTVEFEQATRSLLAAGHRLFIEVSPHPVVTLGIEETAASVDDLTAGRTAVVGTLRRDEGGPDRFLRSLAEAQVGGATPDWEAVFAGRGARRVDLPTYAFQRRSHWLATETGPARGLGQAGLESPGHPLLGAAVHLVGSGGLLFTGRLSRRGQPWLAEHRVGGRAVLPGAALADLALYAAARAGCAAVRELVLEAPLELPPDGAVQVQMAVGAAEADGVRPLDIYGRRTGGTDDGESWRRYATGTVGAPGATGATGATGVETAGAWPPEGAEPLALDRLDDRFAAAGVHYGPSFRGLRSVWRRGTEVYAEVDLPLAPRSEAGRFGLHPALLDAALQPLALTLDDPGEGAPRPFSWHDLTLYDTGRTSLRVALRRTGADRITVELSDEDGRPVASVGSLVLRAQTPAPGDDNAVEAGTAVRLPPGAGPSDGPHPLAGGALPGGLPERAADGGRGWARRLAGLDEPEQLRLLQDLVRTHAASVLGHPAKNDVPVDRSFRDIGFESLTAVELCKRLNSATGVRLPAVTVFDHPTPVLLARRLREELTAVGGEARTPVLVQLDTLEAALADADADTLTRATARLNALLWKLEDSATAAAPKAPEAGATESEDLSAISDLEMFALIDKEFGSA